MNIGIAYGGAAVGVSLLPVALGAVALVGVGVLIGVASKPTYKSSSCASSNLVMINGRLYRLKA
jgi:hypothetical protein